MESGTPYTREPSSFMLSRPRTVLENSLAAESGVPKTKEKSSLYTPLMLAVFNFAGESGVP